MGPIEDHDFERRYGDVKRLGAALAHFQAAVTKGMVAMKETSSAFESIGQAFMELTGSAPTASYVVTGGTAGTVVTSLSAGPHQSQLLQQQMHQRGAEQAANAGAPSMGFSSVLANSVVGAEETMNSRIHWLAELFATEAKELNEGATFQKYNKGVHKEVINRLLPVQDHLKSIEEAKKERCIALEHYQKHKARVNKKEMQCAKRGKAFSDSSKYKAYVEKREKCYKTFIEKRDRFNEKFQRLLEVNDHAAAFIIERYLALNADYLRAVLRAVEKVIPAMEEVYPLGSQYELPSFLGQATDTDSIIHFAASLHFPSLSPRPDADDDRRRRSYSVPATELQSAAPAREQRPAHVDPAPPSMLSTATGPAHATEDGPRAAAAHPLSTAEHAHSRTRDAAVPGAHTSVGTAIRDAPRAAAESQPSGDGATELPATEVPSDPSPMRSSSLGPSAMATMVGKQEPPLPGQVVDGARDTTTSVEAAGSTHPAPHMSASAAFIEAVALSSPMSHSSSTTPSEVGDASKPCMEVQHHVEGPQQPDHLVPESATVVKSASGSPLVLAESSATADRIAAAPRAEMSSVWAAGEDSEWRHVA